MIKPYQAISHSLSSRNCPKNCALSPLQPIVPSSQPIRRQVPAHKSIFHNCHFLCHREIPPHYGCRTTDSVLNSLFPYYLLPSNPSLLTFYYLLSGLWPSFLPSPTSILSKTYTTYGINAVTFHFSLLTMNGNKGKSKSMGYPGPSTGPTASGVSVRPEASTMNGSVFAIWGRVAASIKPGGHVASIPKQDFNTWSIEERENIQSLMA